MTGTRTLSISGTLLGILPLLGVLVPAAVSAQTSCTTGTLIPVNAFFDEEDDDPSDGACLTPSGFCTLRAAIEHANATGGTFRIILGAGTYTLTIGGGGSATASEGDLDIYGANICIQGSASGPTVLDAGGIDRFFDIAGTVDVRLENLVITGGDPGIGSPPGSTSANGGGVRIGFTGAPTVTMTQVTVKANEATLSGFTPSSGGGIYSTATLILDGCSVRQNLAKTDGGGVYTAAGGTTTITGGSVESNDAERGGGIGNLGTTALDQVFVAQNVSTASGGGIHNGNAAGITIDECVIEENQAGTPPGSVQGGGVNNTGTADVTDTTIRANAVSGSGGGWSNGALGSADLLRSTVSGNAATLNGAGIQNAGGVLTAVNCTVSQNIAIGNGGGLYTFAAATSTLRNVTVAFNSAASAGGIHSDVFAPGVCELRNSILADNSPANSGGTTPLLATGVVLDSDGSAALAPPHISGVAALLGPLAPNGGATETHALLAGSPAIDAGSPADCGVAGVPLLEDQRGSPRPEDGDGSGAAECDLGSFEAPPGSACATATWNPVTSIGANPGARGEHGMAFDSARGVTVLFGGSISQADTWEYDGSWQQVATTGPGVRWGHAMAYDSARGVAVLFGGFDNFVLHAETWEWNGTSWTQVVTPNSPPARVAFSMAYDSARGVTVLFGGRTISGTYFGDTWEYDGTTWVQQFPLTSPSAREGAALAYDTARGVTVLYGGSAGIVNQDTWEWNGMAWTLRVGASPPGFRSLHAAAYDSASQRTLVYGGFFSGDEVWGWDGTNWTQVIAAGTGPGGRTNFGLTYDSARQVAVMMGGYANAGGATQSDMWEIGCPSTPAAPEFIRGDCETNLLTSIGDAILMLTYLFPPGAPPLLNCEDACDANDDGMLNIADAIYMLTYQFVGGTVPPPPSPPPVVANCGPDPTPDTWRCASHPCP